MQGQRNCRQSESLASKTIAQKQRRKLSSAKENKNATKHSEEIKNATSHTKITKLEVKMKC